MHNWIYGSTSDNFHNNTWMKKIPKSTLLFTDMDSLVYEVVGHHLYNGMAEIKKKENRCYNIPP